MTLAEKLGQLTMTASSYAVSGPIIVGDSTDAIKLDPSGLGVAVAHPDDARRVGGGGPRP